MHKGREKMSTRQPGVARSWGGDAVYEFNLNARRGVVRDIRVLWRNVPTERWRVGPFAAAGVSVSEFRGGRRRGGKNSPASAELIQKRPISKRKILY